MSEWAVFDMATADGCAGPRAHLHALGGDFEAFMDPTLLRGMVAARGRVVRFSPASWESLRVHLESLGFDFSGEVSRATGRN